MLVYVYVDGGDGMGKKWEDTRERKLLWLLTLHGRQHYAVGRELDCGFLLLNYIFLFHLISGS